MDQETVDAAELVAEFKGLRDGWGRLVGCSVRWHGPSRRWVIDLRPFFTGTGEPDGLRTLAEAILDGALDRCELVIEPVIAHDEGAGVEASFESANNGGTLSLGLYIFLDHETEFVGVSRRGEPLYHNRWGGSLIELWVDPVKDVPQLVAVARAVLAGLDAHPEAASGRPSQLEETVAEFHKPGRTSATDVRLAVLWREQDARWAVRIPSVLKVPTEPQHVRAFAEGLRHAARTSESVSCLLMATDRFQVQATIGPDPGRDTYFLEVKVAASAEDGGQHILNIIGGGRFEGLDRAQLETTATSLLAKER